MKQVDRELLERADKRLSDWLELNSCECESGHYCGRNEVTRDRDSLRAILAQPAEEEWLERWSELKTLAEKATPGPWWVDSHGHRVSTEDGMQTVFIAADKMGPATRHPETGNLSHWPNDWDASYIVNASPDKILELIAALSAVTAERDRLRDALEQISPEMDAAGKRAIDRAREDGCASIYSLAHVYCEAAISAALAAKEA